MADVSQKGPARCVCKALSRMRASVRSQERKAAKTGTIHMRRLEGWRRLIRWIKAKGVCPGEQEMETVGRQKLFPRYMCDVAFFP